MNARILIVEDDTANALIVERWLSSDGYEVLHAENIKSSKEIVINNDIDLVILDVNLSNLVRSNDIQLDFQSLNLSVGGEGFDIAAWLRDNHPQIRIIFLTSRESFQDKIRGLDVGGDDYLSKPIHPAELLAKVRSLLRRAGKKSESAKIFGMWEFNAARQELVHLMNIGAGPIRLTFSEAKMLSELLESNGQIISRESLSKRVFGRPSTPRDRAVDTTISKLRTKLGDGTKPGVKYIETIQGVGYRLR